MSELTVDIIAKVSAKLRLLSLALEHQGMSHEAANNAFYLLDEVIEQLGQIPVKPRSELGEWN